jgi:RNA polymerase sigma-70 factor (ECF subfamily)
LQNLESILSDFNLQLRSFVVSKITNKPDVDDILQDVYIKIHSNIGKLKNETKFESWMYQITRNAINDYYRKQKKQSDTLPETITIMR